MNILGISAFYHDSAAAIIIDGKVIAAAQEERFTRKKQDESFPVNAVRYCLDEAALHIDQLDAVVFYDKPMLKFERLLETYYAFSPRGIASFIIAIPVWLKEKVFLKKIIADKLSEIEPYNKKKLKLLFTEHHLSHAASAFYPSTFPKAAILTVDGVGEWATASICYGEGKKIQLLKEMKFPHSLGLLYSAFTYYLGFRVNSGEYKLMGLAPYGIPGSEQVETYVKIIRNQVIEIKEDGSVWLNPEFFSYATGLRMVPDKRWETLFGFKKRLPEETIEQHHCDLAFAIQLVTEEIMLKMVQHAKEITGCDTVCLAGGVALNCVANGKLLANRTVKDLYVQPASGDAGGALGAALAAYHIYFDRERVIEEGDAMSGSYLGPSYTDHEVKRMVGVYGAQYKYYESFDELAVKVAGLLADGNVVGWVQGRMEFGPRALGNRSILGDARNRDMQKKLNLKIKYRESFRPFAPSVLAEDNGRYFDIETSSPYMLLVAPVKEQWQKKLPDNYYQLPLMERLYVERSEIPAITHIDMSARIQTVHRDTNPRYWQLINEFKKLTGIGLVVNTSFNVRGEPIICSPDDAYRCFMRTEMDYLVINNFLFVKEQQPAWNEKDNWKEEFKPD
ncbi:MAG TPA: carbamoyltransferase [Prolixibacteraceae bacterium]|nr:carbamoyltransferase [Prolixibacteraceae bacterium]HUM89102.1 carbamoyltransferase [Prolixibacteraceae bacterium]